MRSAKQAAMTSAGLASGTQVYSSRRRQVPQQNQIRVQRQEPSGSEARLGDILVTILERLSSLEAKISASHYGNSVNDMEARLADIQQSNSDYMAHIFREIESVKIMIDDPQFNMHNTSPINTTSPLNMRNRRSPQYTEDLEYIPTGMGRTYRYGSLSSVGTNDIGYDGEYNSDVASPTPSEIKDMENTNISGTGYVVDCDNDVSSLTPSESNDIENIKPSWSGYVVEYDNDVSSLTPSESNDIENTELSGKNEVISAHPNVLESISSEGPTSGTHEVTIEISEVVAV